MAGRTTSGALALVMAGLGVVLGSCGGSTSSAPGTGAAGGAGPPPIGKPVRMQAGGTTLVLTVRRVIFPLRDSGVLLLPGDAAAGVEVSVRNAGRGVYDSSSESDVALRTSSGELAEPGFAPRGPCTTSEVDFLKDVAPGESRSGCVAFDVPKGQQPATVRFAPEGRTALARTWVVRGGSG